MSIKKHEFKCILFLIKCLDYKSSNLLNIYIYYMGKIPALGSVEVGKRQQASLVPI